MLPVSNESHQKKNANITNASYVSNEYFSDGE